MMRPTGRQNGMGLTIGTRGSALARWQTNHIRDLLSKEHPGLDIGINVITTRGDKILDASLPSIGGKGLFTAELESALLDGSIDVAVHSAKDVPTDFPEGLVIGAVTRRFNSADVLVSAKRYAVGTLPRGAVIGTSSPRRA
ncbi:MAG: hydroxymethylbilane synthase, partial [Candidatus Latescibacterota bacterium]